jgi:hypothetical protein
MDYSEKSLEEIKTQKPKINILMILISIFVFFLGFVGVYSYFSYQEYKDKEIISTAFLNLSKSKVLDYSGNFDFQYNSKISLGLGAGLIFYFLDTKEYKKDVTRLPIYFEVKQKEKSFDLKLDKNLDDPTQIIAINIIKNEEGKIFQSFYKAPDNINYNTFLYSWKELDLNLIQDLGNLLLGPGMNRTFVSFKNYFGNVSQQFVDLTSVTKKYPNENIKGKENYHYAILLDKEKVKDKMFDYINWVFDNQYESKETEFSINLRQKKLKDLNFFIDKMDPVVWNIWIEKDSLEISRLSFNCKSDLQLSLILIVNFETNLSDIKIETPANAQTLEDIYTQNLHEPIDDVGSDIDKKRISNIKQIQTDLELYYTDNYKYPIAQNLKLGVEEAVCLDNQGFGLTCVSSYVALMPKEPSEGKYFVYNSQDGTHYTIDFSLDNDTYGFTSGPIKATESGMSQ